MRIAFMTYGTLQEPYGAARVQGFEFMLPLVFAEAEAAPGFIARAIKPDVSRPSYGQVFGEWGEFALPRFYDGGRTERITQAATLSLWEDIESAWRFTYSGLHARALKHRGKWFNKPAWPTYVMWWVPDDHIPTWAEASERLEYLHDNGPTPHAFSFKHAFDALGARTEIARPKQAVQG